MSKSIPLKEIVGFLPYQLKVFLPADELTIDLKEFFFDKEYYTHERDLRFIKPIVRPLSDLTKEITHNGETFVPLVKYMTEWFGEPCEDFNEFEMCDIEKSFLSVLRKYEMRTQKELEFLYEYNFDIYDWIKDGLAVDINTI